ncbi:hypothetical protein OQA88_12482 [Cercophora sp. LCS_1]
MRLDNPRFNTDKFPPEHLGVNSTLPPIISKRGLWRRDNASIHMDYSVPDELKEAAKEVAESTKHVSSFENTAKPAVIYFPSGTYLVSGSIVQCYNTQFLGNPINRPVILAASSFVGLGVFSSNVYIGGGGGAEWYVPQNNFLRSIRNFVIDIQRRPMGLYFYMEPGTTQQASHGIWMENGSGGMLNPRPVVRVGRPGDTEIIEISDMMVSVQGKTAGILIESQSPTWLWSTSSEHNVLYQYQLSNARNIFLSMNQTESPYFQPEPKAPRPFMPGVFPEDPDFSSCSAASSTRALSSALRLVDSNNIFMPRGVEIENSAGVWIYALATKAIIEMVSPVKMAATLAAPNKNGYLSSVLAWLRGSTNIAGPRFEGWDLFPNGSLADAGLTPGCEAAMYQTIKCDNIASTLAGDGPQGGIGNVTVLKQICDPTCAQSLRYMHAIVISNFEPFGDLSEMDPLDLCSYCLLENYRLMHESPYSFYDDGTIRESYEYIADVLRVCRRLCPDAPRFGLGGPASDRVHVRFGQPINPNLQNCGDEIPEGTQLYFPLSCNSYVVGLFDTCVTIAAQNGITVKDLEHPNVSWGFLLCVSPPGGAYTLNTTGNGTSVPWAGGDGYRFPAVLPPVGSTVAPGTTTRCGAWYTHTKAATNCPTICLGYTITSRLFLGVNPSLSSATCDDDLILGDTYCVGPTVGWNDTAPAPPSSSTFSLPLPSSTSGP